MVAQNRTVIDGGEEETAVQHIPDRLAEAREIVGARVKGVVFIDEEGRKDDGEEQGQDDQGGRGPELLPAFILRYARKGRSYGAAVAHPKSLVDKGYDTLC